MTNLIAGINPITISSIKVTKFERFGPHPLWLRYMKKKNPIRGLFGFYSRGLFDGYYAPAVLIRGSDRSTLLTIRCRSNDHAVALAAEMNEKLERFLSEIKTTA